MTSGTGEPTPERRPLAVGTGNTGNPCEYPGCADKNASLSTIWERSDQDHDFGGTNRELRCVDHWGKDAPRIPRPRVPLPVDPGWKPVVSRKKRGRSVASPPSRSGKVAVRETTGAKGKRRGASSVKPTLGKAAAHDPARTRGGRDTHPSHGRGGRLKGAVVRTEALDENWLKDRKPTSMVELAEARLFVVALLNVGRYEDAVRLCSILLATGEGLMAAAKGEGDRMRSVLKACRIEAYNNLRRKGAHPSQREAAAKKSRGESPESRSVNGLAPAQPKKRPKRTKVFAETGVKYSKAKRMLARDPQRALSMCDNALRELSGKSDLDGVKEARARWSRLRRQAESRIKGKGSPRR